MDIENIIIITLAMLALLVVLVMMQKFNGNFTNNKNSTYGLKVQNVLYVDNSNKIVTIKSNSGYNYIVAFGKNTQLLIDKYPINTQDDKLVENKQTAKIKN